MKQYLFYGLMAVAGVVLQGCKEDGGSASSLPESSKGTKAAVVQDPVTIDWPLNHQSLAGQRYVATDLINADNVDQLGVAWEFNDFVVRGRTHRGVEANPVVIGDRMYMIGPWNVVYALNPVTGELLWQYDPQVDGQYARNACCDVISRGLAVHGEKLYTATLDGNLVAVDRHTGKELWRVHTFYTDKWNYTITGAPTVAGDKILVGNSGSDMGARGYVSAYDAEDGSLVWRFWAVPGDPELEPDETPDVTFARQTWAEDTLWELGLGGTAWDGMAYDPETNTAFLGLGNGSPQPGWLRSESGEIGDSLFLSSIVAVNADTGRMKWYYQTTPGDSWDYTATAPMVFADLEIEAETRKVIMQAPKNGIFYVLDRITGELLKAEPYTTVTWTSRVDMETGRPVLTEDSDYSQSPKIIWPSVAGGHAWHPMAYSPKTGYVYIPTTDLPIRHELAEPSPLLPGTRFNTRNQFPPFDNPGDRALLEGRPEVKAESRLKAWDPVAQKTVWQSDAMPLIIGGSLVVGDLVFHGASDGYLRAFDAETGEVVHEIFVGTSIMAAPMSYVIDGEQYIAVAAGAGGPRGSGFAPNEAAYSYQNFERLIVFKLEGARVEVPPPYQQAELPPLPEAIEASPELQAQGQELYEWHCQRCHKIGGGRSNYPDLWRMEPGTIAAFEAILLKGAFKYAGMANFDDVLTGADVQAIKAFIINDTRKKQIEGGEAGARDVVGYH